jgi:IS30 family transposase
MIDIHLTQNKRHQIDSIANIANIAKANFNQSEIAKIIQHEKLSFSSDQRSTIPNQDFIKRRPAITLERARFGDWETDLVIGTGQKQTLVTINERASRYLVIVHTAFKTAQAVGEALMTLLKPFAYRVHTRMTNNGNEFTPHE